MRNNLDIITDLIESAKKKGADSADAISFFSNNTSVSTRLGKLENIESSESCGFGLRVLIGQKQALVSTTSTDSDKLDELSTRAINMAKLAPEDKFIGLAEKPTLCNMPPDLDLYDSNQPSPEELLSLAQTAEETALSTKGVTNSEGGEASFGYNVVTLITSNGFSGEYTGSMSSISVSVLAGEGSKMERDYDFSSARFACDLEPAEKIGKTAAQNALKRLNPRRAKTCNVPVVFAPRVAKSLISSLASATNGASVARGATFLKTSMGKAIFNKTVNIVNDPHIKRGLASKPYDAEGASNNKLLLIQEGFLQNWLLDIRSANQLGLKTNGCAARGVSSLPSPAYSNLYMENGQLTPGDLISSIKSGFYVTETFGMGVNIITGDYSQGASGFWIENGKITYPINEVTIAGTLTEMFMQLTPANDLEFRYNVNSPTLLIEKMTVAGE